MDEIQFTEREQHWYAVKCTCDKELEKYKESGERDWRDENTLNGLSKYIYYSLKYENLRCPKDDIVRLRKLIKINKVIPTKLLDFDGYEYVLFNGIYIVHDVMFVRKSICDQMFIKGNNIYRNADIGVSDDTIMGSIKHIHFDDENLDYGVCLVHSPFTERYGIVYNSSWDYVYF